MVDELSALGLRHVGYGVPVELPLGLGSGLGFRAEDCFFGGSVGEGP